MNLNYILSEHIRALQLTSMLVLEHGDSPSSTSLSGDIGKTITYLTVSVLVLSSAQFLKFFRLTYKPLTTKFSFTSHQEYNITQMSRTL